MSMQSTEAPAPAPAANGLPVTWPILAALAIIAVFAVAIPLLIVTTAPRVTPASAKVVLAKRVVPKAELPPVDPVELQAVAPTDARAINAAIPFSLAPNPAASAFRIFGAADSQARAVDCLAAAVYYEAGDDAVGQQAVAQVIVNRMHHPAFPKTICGVVFQGSERSTGCQFTFTCDGAMARYTPSPAAWSRARDVARKALTGTVYKPVGHATHYHTDWVVPYWSAKLEKITEVHTHLFFRWAGWWGTPPAFRRGYAGSEPNIGQLARLSSVHFGTGPEPALGLAAADLRTLQPEEIPASAVPAPIAADDDSFLLTLPSGMSADSFASLAIRTCGDRPYCKFMAWSDPAKTPAKLPLASTQVASMSFSYLRDQKNGFAKALWNCDQFKRPSPVQCMRAQPLARAAPPPPPIDVVPPEGSSEPALLSGVRRKGDPAPQPSPTPTGKPAVTFSMPAPSAANADHR